MDDSNGQYDQGTSEGHTNEGLISALKRFPRPNPGVSCIIRGCLTPQNSVIVTYSWLLKA